MHNYILLKKPFKKLLHVSVYDHLQGVTISSLKSLLFKHSCMYTKRGGVAAYHVVCIGFMLEERPSVRVLASSMDGDSVGYHIGRLVL